MTNYEKYGPQIAVTGTRPKTQCWENSDIENGLSHSEADCRDGKWFSHDWIYHDRIPYNYWKVDLGDEYMITRIVIKGRRDKYNTESMDFRVSIGDTKDIDTHTLIETVTEYNQENTIAGKNTKGRWVGIRKTDAKRCDVLSLCSVEVYGFKAPE